MAERTPYDKGIFSNIDTTVFPSNLNSTFSWSAAMCNARHCEWACSIAPKIGAEDRCGVGCKNNNQTRNSYHPGRPCDHRTGSIESTSRLRKGRLTPSGYRRNGVTAEQTFSSLLQSQLRQSNNSSRVVNLGIGGERTDQALNRMDQVFQWNPDLVTIMYGTNDSYIDSGKTTSRIGVDQYRENLINIVTHCCTVELNPS